MHLKKNGAALSPSISTIIFRWFFPAGLIGIFLATLISPTAANSATYAPIQSKNRPFNLDIVDKVQSYGSDKRSASFQNDYLPTMQKWETMDLTSPSFTQLTSTISLDPSKIKLATEYDTRVYFVGDATAKHNALGFNTAGGTVTGGNPKLIFPDASESTATKTITSGKTKTKVPVRTTTDPLLPGDFVSLGILGAGTELDFFLISQRTKKITDVFSTDTSSNPDGLQHAMVFTQADSPYLFIAFRDQLGPAGKFNSTNIFTVEVGAKNVRALTNMPEPSTLMILCSFLSLVAYRKYTIKPFADKT